MIKVPSYLIEPWIMMVIISYTNNKRLELIENHYGVQEEFEKVEIIWCVFLRHKLPRYVSFLLVEGNHHV